MVFVLQADVETVHGDPMALASRPHWHKMARRDLKMVTRHFERSESILGFQWTIHRFTSCVTTIHAEDSVTDLLQLEWSNSMD